jgi:hypothetical protein
VCHGSPVVAILLAFTNCCLAWKDRIQGRRG